MKKILIINQRERWPDVAINSLKRLEEDKRKIFYHQIESEENELEDILTKHQDIDILVTTYFNLTKKKLKLLPKLKVVVTSTTATEYIDKTYLKENKIKLITNEAYTGSSVAEHAFSLIMSLSKRIIELDTLVKSNNFYQEAPPSIEIQGKTIGILGMGDVGKKLAQMAGAFSMNIQYYSRQKKEEIPYPYLPFSDLLKSSDIIAITLPLTNETHHLLSHNEFSLLKENAILVSISPDEIIDQKALKEALKNKNLLVGLDLHHPLEEDFKQFSQKLILTPTKAWHSKECKERRFLKTVEMIKSISN